MTLEQKKKVLKLLYSMKEGNIGGETDITNADNLVAEDEFTGATEQERNVIAKTFDTKADFDSYTNQRRGIEMTPKEQQAVLTYKDATPTQKDRFFIKYETTDDFGNNATTIIKKLKEGNNQFCWTAFSKHETAEEEGKPEGTEEPSLNEQEPPQNNSQPQQNNNNQNLPPTKPEDDEVVVDDPIRITKTITFVNDTEGSNILADFLRKLEL